jgi:GNAT superfamily N-acetyltransferase
MASLGKSVALFISDNDRRRMERAHVLAWPALRTEVIDGWLWRSSGGGSQRANSVSTVDFTGTDLEAAIGRVEALYREAGTPARFQTFDHSAPPGLVDALAARGFHESEATTTMFKRIEPVEAVPDMVVRDHAWDEWRTAYLDEITESRRAVNALILDRVPAPRAFFGCMRDGRVVSTALAVVGFGCVVVECVTTRADARRQGLAAATMRALAHWASAQAADLIGLQVVSSNAAAIGLYQGLGFAAGATNRFWMRSD